MDVSDLSHADIAEAIASERSWHGAGRALGLKGINGGAMRSLKKRVSALGLDTSHFTHQRTWTNSELRDAIMAADTWADVMRALGVNGSSYVFAKGHAVRLGINISHLEPPPPKPLSVLDLRPQPRMLRACAESFAAAWFGVRGIATATPAQPAAYDLLITLPDGVRRVQVKTSTTRGRHGTWVVQIGRRPYVLDKSASRQPYDPDHLDYFFIIDGDSAVYLIPSIVVAGRTRISVGAYTAYRVGDASSLFATANADGREPNEPTARAIPCPPYGDGRSSPRAVSRGGGSR
jgi:hypothetical protein